jgi:hypothetical protein
LMWHLLSSCPACSPQVVDAACMQGCLLASDQLQPLLRIIGSLIGQSWDDERV